jgi:GH15 family glucan-1,4-alpha-glucosidase
MGPRVVATLAAIERELVIDGLVHRFDPRAALSGDQLPLGEFEGAFLPATFWLAHALAKAGRTDEAEAFLNRCEALAGELGLFAEEADARRHTFLATRRFYFLRSNTFERLSRWLRLLTVPKTPSWAKDA